MSPSSRALLLSLALTLSNLVVLPSVVNAQVSSTVTCLSNTTFLYNTRQQSPCLVAAYLGSVCNGGRFTIDPLAPDEHYSGPTVATDCTCSTVTYSLVSACGICQAAEITTWSSWSENCTRVFVTSYPSAIPSPVTVPHWAYADVTLGNTFDPNVALTDTGAESSAPAPAPTTSTSTSSFFSFTSTSSTNTNTATNTSSSSGGTNVGAIAGGVVGGVVALAAIGLGVFFCMRRRNQQGGDHGSGKSPVLSTGGMTENGMGANGGGLGLNAGYANAGGVVGAMGGLSPNNTGTYGTSTTSSPPPMQTTTTGTQYGVQQWTTPSSPTMSNQLAMRPYDPNDPTTFPSATGSPVPSGGMVYPASTGGSGQYNQGVQYNQGMGMAGVGAATQGYSYAPEIQDSRMN